MREGLNVMHDASLSPISRLVYLDLLEMCKKGDPQNAEIAARFDISVRTL